MKFSDHQEDERVNHTNVIGVNADQIGIKAARVDVHGQYVGEHEEEQQSASGDLNNPQSSVFVLEKMPVSLNITELMIRSRETTQSAESVDRHCQGNEANEGNVHPKVFFTVQEGATRGSDQVSEQVFAKVDRARKGHMAEEEETEDKTRNRLTNIQESGRATLTLNILKASAPNVFVSSRGVAVFDRIRGRHIQQPREGALFCASNKKKKMDEQTSVESIMPLFV